MKYYLYGFLCLTALLFSAMDAEAAEITPFQTKNQSPLVSIYGLPAISEGGVKTKSSGALRLTMDLANHYATNRNARENIVLDGESTRLTLSGRYGIGRQAELGMEIPFLILGGGFLDNFIESYHSTFGFPNGGREMAGRNRLLFRYQKNGVTLLNREQSGQGLGDVSVTGGWQLYQSADERRHLALRGSLKLPTGDTDSLFGSGSTDLALWMTGSMRRDFDLGQFSLFGAAGVMGMTKGKILPDQQRPAVGFGALGVGFSPAQWIELKIQANAHTSFYSGSDLAEVSGASAQLTVGGALHFSAKTSLDVGVTEDIVVGTSPDVVFHLSLGHTF